MLMDLPVKCQKQILPTELCCKSLGILVDTLLGGIIGEVENLKLIAPNETYRLKYLLSLMSQAESWFEIVKIKGGLSRKKTTEQVKTLTRFLLFILPE